MTGLRLYTVQEVVRLPSIVKMCFLKHHDLIVSVHVSIRLDDAELRSQLIKIPITLNKKVDITVSKNKLFVLNRDIIECLNASSNKWSIENIGNDYFSHNKFIWFC